MAIATPKPTFSFHHLFHKPSSSSSSSQPPLLSLRPPPIHHFIHGGNNNNNNNNKRFSISHHNYHFTLRSIDVSKEDTPPSSSSDSYQQPPPPAAAAETENSSEEKIDKRRVEEKFAVLNTGIYECRSCGYKYDEAVGDPSYPIPAGYEFEKLPEDWRCPTCGAAKSFFESKMVEIAGFAQNQQYGLGGNTLTSGQKAALIYGSLFLFFLLFLSGYFLP